MSINKCKIKCTYFSGNVIAATLFSPWGWLWSMGRKVQKVKPTRVRFGSCTVYKSIFIHLYFFCHLWLKGGLISNGITPSALYSESIKSLSVLHSGFKHEWQLILTRQKIQYFFYESFFTQLFSGAATLFWKNKL